MEKRGEKGVVGVFKGNSDEVKKAVQMWEDVYDKIEVAILDADPTSFHFKVLLLVLHKTILSTCCLLLCPLFPFQNQFQSTRFNHLKRCLELLRSWQLSDKFLSLFCFPPLFLFLLLTLLLASPNNNFNVTILSSLPPYGRNGGEVGGGYLSIVVSWIGERRDTEIREFEV